MATLTEPVKIFIVQSLACMRTPQQVADDVKQEFDIELDRRQCASYDPTKVSGVNLGADLKDLFEKTRRDFLKNVLDIPIANKAFRVRELQDMYDGWGKNKIMKQNVLKQVKDEMQGYEAEVHEDNGVEIRIIRVGRNAD